LIQEIQAPASHLAYKAMLELRPNIGPELVFTDHVDKVLRPEGYRLGEDRADAHRLYFNKRMRISSYHFSRPV
jgi:hypothetical protein